MDSPGSISSDLRRQNEELRARLAGESADHKRRLEAYRRAQQGQASLVSRLQAKVLQYKQRCAELENQMLESTPRSDPSYRQPSKTCIALPAPAALPTPSSSEYQMDERINDLETALRRLDEEKRKCEKLLSQNNLLRDQLEESHQLNEALTNDLQKLTNDWEALRDEMAIKEDEWKDEEQAFNDYYSSEHNRLLSLWREVVAVKRFFSDLQTSTERDLYKVKNDFDSVTRDLVGTLSGYAITSFASQNIKPDCQQALPTTVVGVGTRGAVDTLRSELRDVTSQRDAATAELRERDARIQRLLQELQALEERCDCAEAACAEGATLRNALEQVARALIQDSDGDRGEAREGRAPSRRAATSTVGDVAAFAESTLSAVQAALHNYHLHIHDLQVKLDNCKDQLSASRKQCEAADGTVAALEDKLRDLQGKLDQTNIDLNQVVQERESLQKTVETLRADKNNLERNRLEINAMVESLTSDYEKLQKINSRLEKNIEALEEDKRALNAELDRLHREAASRESVLRAEEERSTRLRSELVTVREELNKTALARDLLDQQKIETDSIFSQMEKHRSELEIELERTILERGDLQDLMEKLESALRDAEAEKTKLQEDIKQLEAERGAASRQAAELQADLASLRKELLAGEQARMALDAERAALLDRLAARDGAADQLELQLRQLARERSELSSQLSEMARKKEALKEEMARLQQRLEQAGDTIARLNRSVDDHVKDGEQKQAALAQLERERQQLQEALAGARAERDALEAALFDTGALLDDAQAKGAQLERQLTELLVRHEDAKGQIASLTKDLESSDKKLRETRSSLQQQSGKKEAEYQQIITNLNRTTTENITKLKEEKEQLRQALEQKLSQMIASLNSEKEIIEASARERERKLLALRDQLMLQHDEALLRAENDKQQALLMAHQEHQALLERLEDAKRALDCEQSKLERLRREAQVKADQDRTSINQLKDELAALRNKLEEAKASAEDECARHESRTKELQLEKEALGREGQELRAALALAEHRHEAAHAQLQDALRKLKEGRRHFSSYCYLHVHTHTHTCARTCTPVRTQSQRASANVSGGPGAAENEAEGLRKELCDARRQLASCRAEREQLASAARDLRAHVKRAEHERRDAARARDDAYHKIAGLEESRASVETELARVQALLKEAECGGEASARSLRAAEAQLKRERAALEQAQHDAKELQSRLQNESEERERSAAEACALKRRGAELEALLAAARTDLNAARQRCADLEDACRARDQELMMRLEDCRSKERRLEELKHNLEVCLADATQQIQELKTRLSACESRSRSVEASLAQSEAGRREAEARLSSVAHTLRRVCGVQPDGSVAAARRRLASPARRYSPHRGRDHSEDRNEIIDVDPELIKKGVRNFMHEVCQMEREKEEYKAQAQALQKQVREATQQRGKGEGRLQALGADVRALHEERARLQAAAAHKDAQLGALNESIQAKTTEISNLRDKITSLEAALSSVTEDKVQNENKSESLRLQLAERIQEIAQLREALTAAEGRGARLDVRRAQLEGDVQRAAVAARDRDQALKKLQERCEGQQRSTASLEERCTSLKGTVEQLSGALQKAAAAESELRAELSKAQRALAEARGREQSALDKLRQAQKNCTNCENDRRVLSEKLESAKSALSELKRLNATLEDQAHRLTKQLADVEVQRSALESQLRVSAWEGGVGGVGGVGDSSDGELQRELHELQRDRAELKAQNEALQVAFALQETVRRAWAERRGAAALRSRSHERDKLYYGDLDSGPDSNKDSIRDPKEPSCTCKGRGFNAELKMLELENRELRMKIRRLEKELSDKEAELSLARGRYSGEAGGARREEAERHTQRLLEAREAAHRDHVARLEAQASQLRAQLAAELRRRQAYVARSGRAARDVQRLRSALGDSLRAVSQDPALDSRTLQQEARKLDTTLAHSLPPLGDAYDVGK
ncbi:unnamed protein product, partial [Iphiclides podalirius]